MTSIGPSGTANTMLSTHGELPANRLSRQLSGSQMRRVIAASMANAKNIQEASQCVNAMFEKDLLAVLGFVDQCQPDANCLADAILAGGVVTGDLQLLHALNPELCKRHMQNLCRLSARYLQFLRAYVMEVPGWVDTNIDLLSHPLVVKNCRNMNYLFGLTLEDQHSTTAVLRAFVETGKLDCESMDIKLKEPTALMYLHYRDLQQCNEWGEHSEHRTLNPLLLKMAPKSWHQARPTETLLGVSRSTLNPAARFDSSLVQAFQDRHRALPLATFGPEYEIFFPGVSGTNEIAFEEIKALFPGDLFALVEDGSLNPDMSIAPPFELVFRVLQSPDDIQEFQGALARLNDMGVLSNRTSGVHIHLGVKQWTASSIGLRASSLQRYIDTPSPHEGITPLQLAFAQQLVLNFASVQHIFYQVSRLSMYSKPIAAEDPGHYATPENMNVLTKNVNGASTLRELTELVGQTYDAEKRYRVLNLQAAFDKHGTFEVRGFSKVFADHMDVDPNLPVRDMVFLQDLIRTSLNDVRVKVDQYVAHKTMSDFKANPAMVPIAIEYVQDTLRLGVLHALSQRGQGRRIMTMDALMALQPHFSPQTLARLHPDMPGMQHWVNDGLGEHFLRALSVGTSEWKPTRFTVDKPMPRAKSLRSMADEHLPNPGVQ